VIHIDYQDPRPIYEQIIDRFEKMILCGVLQPDEKMPSVRQMATTLSINPNTIQKAYTVLELRGYIYTVRGRGSFVSDTSKLQEQKKVRWIEELYTNLREGKALGVTKDQCESAVRKIYEEEKNDRA
jgi:GntR family transcriptional regulator